jgi:hypothetical protein
MNKIVVVGSLLVVTALAAGCSSSVKPAGTRSAAGTPTVSASLSAAPSSSAAAAAPGQTQLAGVVLAAADVPTGFLGSAHTDDPGDAADQAAMVQCVGGKNTDPDKVATANSPDFSLNDAQISSSATSYQSQADIDADIALIQNPKVSGCYQQLLKTQIASSLPAGTTVSSVAVTIISGSNGGPSNVVGMGTGTVIIAQDGQQVPIYIAVAFITGRLTESEVDFENPTQPIPASVFSALVTTVATRSATL